ncbi:MAG: phosphopantetheine-binding protein [Spirochaetaceae bacterium]|jgi:acyl carrier protein|nr:phosphopantetheine-binding protein [Spirochaetaceae bacterium]
MSKDDLFAALKDILVQEFYLDPAAITPGASLAADLDLDSIDAVDIMVKMKEYTVEKIDPAQFKNVKTLQDVVDILFPLVKVS